MRIKNSASIDSYAVRAIADVNQTNIGSLKIKLHDKLAALDKLARALGMYQRIEDAESKTQRFAAVTIYEDYGPSPAHRKAAPQTESDDRDAGD